MLVTLLRFSLLKPALHFPFVPLRHLHPIHPRQF